LAVRLKDIAQELGVSVVTVSKVLRGRPDIGEETRQRVLRRMQELNYRPNMVARGLVTGRTYTIGLIVPDLVQPYFAELARSLSGVLRGADRALILASSQGDPAIEQSEMQTLLQRGVDVLLLASCQADTWNLDAVRATEVPCILVDRNLPKSGMSFVGIDDFRAGALATEHLASIGKKRIAHIAGGGTWPSAERLRGYQSALRKHSLQAREEYVVATSGLEEDGDSIGCASMQQLLRLPEPPDAVFCYNDMAALGAMHAADEAGLRIPADIAFVGCGNVGFAKYLRHPLTSIDQSVSELGRIAGELALLLDENRARRAETVQLEPKLIVRDSTVTASTVPKPRARAARKTAK
jgi:LacI family transcriptional regulator